VEVLVILDIGPMHAHETAILDTGPVPPSCQVARTGGVSNIDPPSCHAVTGSTNVNILNSLTGFPQ